MPAMFRLVKGKNFSRAMDIRNKKFRQSARQEWIFASDDFIELIRSRYYRGRKGKIGLNRVEHILHNSWMPRIREESDDIISVMSPDGVKYALVHELEISEKEKSTTPRRTFVRRDIKRGEGKKIFTDAVRFAMKAAY